MTKHQPDSEIQIDTKKIGLMHPAYFIADIAANHDGDLSRAKDLIYLAAEAGADAAKFQHFAAETIVSDRGFKNLGGQQSHQSKWKRSVFQSYKDASVSLEWTPALKETCDKAGITFFTSPYSLELVDSVDPFVPAYKIGSGDITWLEIIEYICSKDKPTILATGASTMEEVDVAVATALGKTSKFVLLQCNTNYTGSLENFKYVQLNVLKTYAERFPGMILGLSDHTPGLATVLGAITLGARVIEKHFTDNSSRDGPDHAFSMEPGNWREMVDRSRELQNALGDGVKKVEDNEKETVVLQRRSLRFKHDLPVGTEVRKEHLIALRPCPTGALAPSHLREILGKKVKRNMKAEDSLKWDDLT